MFVVGTAGHVDHGKSTLVRALTGIDPDRLREEQEREMTIDLGFAWLTLSSGREVSLVDVPGHERFIKNMLVGVGGIDAALLVIATDEGPMPQTREHLAILDLLGVRHGLIVLTKRDLVDDEWLDLVRAEIVECVAGTTLGDAPVVAVSARTGAGLDELRAQLDALLGALPAPALAGRPRLPIDRVFTIAGFGTVVTGTLLGGSLRVGDEVEAQPRGLRARVRGIQSHRQRLEQAAPRTRVAINLTGMSVSDLARGDVLTVPGWLRPSDRLDLRLRLLDAAPGPIVQNEAVDFFTGAAEAPGRLTLLDRDELSPGEEGWVQIRLARPIAVVRHDRFILRQPSPSLTIGGGVVVDAHPHRHRRFDHAALESLAVLRSGTPAEHVFQALARGPMDLKSLSAQTGLTAAEVAAAAGELLKTDDILILAATPPPAPGPGDVLAARPAWEALVRSMTDLLAAYHARYPLRAGAPREEVRGRLDLLARLFDRVVARAAVEGHVVEDGPLLRLPAFTVTLSPTQEQQAERILKALRAAPAAPPSLSDLAADPELVGALVQAGRIVKVTDATAFEADAYAALLEWTLTTIDAEGSVTVAGLRDRFNTSRKHALAFLEHLDQRRLTRRQGDTRVRW